MRHVLLTLLLLIGIGCASTSDQGGNPDYPAAPKRSDHPLIHMANTSRVNSGSCCVGSSCACVGSSGR